MARKKYKNFKVEQEELKPITIGVFESRKKTSLSIFVILTLFVLFVIFLPEISEKVNEYLNPTPSTPVTPVNPTPDEPTEPDDPDENIDETFYSYIPNLTIKREELEVNNLLIDTTTNTLTYNIVNKTTNYQNTEELNYYIEIYNADKTFLERVKLASSGLLAANSSKSYERTISPNTALTAGFIVLDKKTTIEYPEVNLVADGAGISNLVCSKEHEEVTYKFEDNKLKELTSIIEYNLTDTDYANIYANYQTLASTYNTTKGITSNLFNSTTGFNITTIVNLEEASRTNIFNADTFKLDTEPKIVSFEMEAMGFNCN